MHKKGGKRLRAVNRNSRPKDSASYLIHLQSHSPLNIQSQSFLKFPIDGVIHSVTLVLSIYKQVFQQLEAKNEISDGQCQNSIKEIDISFVIAQGGAYFTPY